MWGLSLLLFCGCCGLCFGGVTRLPGPHPTLDDVNECADSTICPTFSTCTNTIGSYYCACKQGFRSSNGQPHFTDPGVQCHDIDECSQSPSPCGPHSVCENLRGRYKCSCLPGFFSPLGDGWIHGKPGHFHCTDINECLNRRVCPEHSVCTNSEGSYSCSCRAGFVSNNSTCKDVDECAGPRACPEHATCFNALGSYSCACNPGFESRSGRKSFRGLREACEDVDECSKNSSLCGANSVCVNTPGGYNCSCLPGFFSASGRAPADTKALQCTDVDECLQDPSPCGPDSVCTNTPGSYSCGCTVGFRPHPEGSQRHGNFSCKRVPFKCREDVIPYNELVQRCHGAAAGEPDAAQVSFCTLMNATFGVLDESCESKAPPASLKTVAENFASVLEQASMSSVNFTRAESSALATVLLQSVESATVATLLRTSGSGGQCVRTQQLDIESKVIKDGCVGESKFFSLKAKGDKMKISCSMVEEAEPAGEPAGLSGVAFVSFAGMESILDERFLEDPWGSGDNSGRKLKMNSRVVGGLTTGEKKEGFSEPIVYTLENIQPKQEHERPICVSWSTDVDGGRWTRSGCVILEASETYTVCSCNRMANLAIIMASGELTLEFALYIISHTGMVISLLCLALAILTFLLCRSIRNHNTYLHLHLCVCLFLAKILFLVGIDKTENRMGCAIIAGFLHYLFLACFFWMLLEAIMLTLTVRNLKVVNYFSSRNIKMVYLCAFGYGLPALVVAVSAGVQPQGYGMHNRCWLNTDTGFVWSFLGPVCVIIKINSVLLTWTLCVLRQKLSSVNAEVSTLRDTRLLTFKAFAQLFILGCTWVLGIFQIGPVAHVMAYLFTVVNSLQGAFIFLIHCLLSRQVREEYRRWLCRRPKPSSQSQTTGMVLLSTPSASKM
ncbi:LOW QUALITY PROTEIN: adhesion G protein-coupled receptor E1-like, partial [Lepus europaeus]|uniref:LOW QUALITY PROTEIN: adhesion G protein-coupled receptor E1-like n=1 Tax=Lepus europaeus TaxID=9983 RepID=UPI002B4689DB